MLTQLRSNAGTLLGAISIATGFLAGLAGPHIGGWGRVAVAAFIVAAVLNATVLWPRTRWRFRLRADVLLEGYVTGERRLT